MNSLDRRRELNRVAAQKLRNKRKERAVTIRSDYFAAQSTNTHLSYELKQLERQKMTLQAELSNHLSICLRNPEESTTQSSLHLSSDNKNTITYWVQAPYDTSVIKQDDEIEYLADSANMSFEEGSNAASVTPESSNDVISYSTQDINDAQFSDVVYSQQFSTGQCPVSNDSFPIRYKVNDSSSSDNESHSPDSSPSRKQTLSTSLFKYDASERQDEIESVDDQSPMLPLCVSYINEQWSTAEQS